MGDYIVRAMAANQQIRAFAITSKEMVEYARAAHNTSPVATAALGRLMSAGAMMGVMMKGDKDVLTLQMKGTGPLRGVTVTSDSKGNVKGYVDNPNADVPPKAKGKLDVGGAIGIGVLNVIKDMGLKEPYNGTCELKTGEIGDDLTYYFATSEQTPCGVSLGVKIAPDGTCVSAGGVFASVLPFASDKSIDEFEKVFAPLSNVSHLMADISAEEFAHKYFDQLGFKAIDKSECGYVCDCTQEKIDKVIISLQKSDIDEIIEQDGQIEVVCQFCNKKYRYDKQQAYQVCGFDK